MKDCKGIIGIIGKDGFMWFIIVCEMNDIVINYVLCEVCYEDILLVSFLYGGEFILCVECYGDFL